MIMAEDEAGRRAALDELLPLQQEDFEGLFAAMEGCRSRSGCSTRRCTSSCPTASSSWSGSPRRASQDAPELAELEHQQERMRALEEGNPMLGTRGVRLGLIHPEIYEMQVRAIFRAARAVDERTGPRPAVEIMIPLVAYARELELARELVVRVAAEEGFEPGRDFGSAP